MRSRYDVFVAAVLALTFAALTTRFSFFIAAIADSSGYLSEASRWLAHDLFGPFPGAFWPEWPDAHLLIPLGYRTGPTAGTDVFTYPPGLPLLMAAAMAGGGGLLAHLVPPIMGGLLVCATGDVAYRLAGPSARIIAAALMGTSAIAFMMSIQIMSDVPAAALWMLSLALVLRGTPLATAAAGLAATMAILTRPNLAFLATVPGALTLISPREGRLARCSLFAVAAAIGPVMVMWTQSLLYGSPLASGHGGIEQLFALAHVPDNVFRYPRWYAEAHTLAVVLAILAPVLFWRAGPTDSASAVRPRHVMVALLAIAGATYAAYLAYFPYTDWQFLRFMLPSIAALYALTAGVLARALLALPRTAHLPSVILILVLTAGIQAKQTYDRQVTEHWKWQQRAAVAGRYLNVTLPRNAIVITFFHSGSIRYYTGLPILRPDLVPPPLLDQLLAHLERRGYHPYLLIDEDLERAGLAARFPQSPIGKPDWPPRARIGTYGRIDVYDLLDRDRHNRGETWPIDVLR